MRALQSFHSENPVNFGAWFKSNLTQRPLPWSWDNEDAEMLLKWFTHFGWQRHLTDSTPSPSAAAAALGVLLAQAYQSCFTGDGDTAVWKRLSQVMGIAETSFGGNVTRLTQHLGLYQDCKAESELIHVIPFLKLVGCPQQALPSLGQQLRSSVPIRKRFRALVTAQWGVEAEAQLKGWLKDGRCTPSFLSPAEAELIQREPEPIKEDQGFTWRLLQLSTGAFQLVLFPIGPLAAGDWRGTSGQPVNVEVAKTYGVPQDLGRDGMVQGGGQTIEVSWPNTPTFWREISPTPRGLRHAFQKAKNGAAVLVCLPPKWSIDGDGESDWRWMPVKGSCTLFDPNGNPWQSRDESPTWEALEGINIEGAPSITILHQLPMGLSRLEVRGGRLGSTLKEGAVWRGEEIGVPPLGHLTLSWTTQKGNRKNKEVYCLPTLQLTKSVGEHPTVWLRGMEGLIGREEGHRYYDLDIQIQGNAWTTSIAFRGWGSTPIHLRMEGHLNPYGAFLYGWRPHHPWPSHGPWYVGPSFPMDAYEANLRIEVILPPTVESLLWVDDRAPLWPEKSIKHQRRLGPLELHEPLRPLWDIVEPLARPVRLSLAWANQINPDDERLRSTLLARIFPREAALGVHVLEDRRLQVMVKRESATPPDLEQLILQIGSVKKPGLIHTFRLSELDGHPVENGIEVQLPDLDPCGGPYHLGLRGEEDNSHPISIHIDGLGRPIPRAIDAHLKAIKGRMIGGIHPREESKDYRDQLLNFAYDLAGTHNLLELLGRDEVDYWLEYLGDDFLFSQPWTLGVALRHPKMTLKHIIRAPWSDTRKLQALGNLGQSGWAWWLIPPADIDSLDLDLRTALRALTSQLARRRVTALHGISNPGVRDVAISRLCEEGLFLPLEEPVRRRFLQQMGFPMELMEQRWKPRDLAARILQQQDPFLVEQIQMMIQPNPDPAPMLPKPPTPGLPGLPEIFERITRLSGWGRAYRQWMRNGTGSLICASSWPDSTPTVFRHYGSMFAFFALLDWQD